jgi:PAS domain S-box-containing protein
LRIPWKHAGIAALTLAAAAGARWALDPFLGFHLPYVTYFVAIAFVAWRTSTRVAVASAIAGWLIVSWLFIPPRFTLSFPPPAVSDWVGSLAYAVVAGAIILMADRMRRALDRSARTEQQLELISHRLPALVSYISPERRYVWCNDEHLRWYGIPRGQIVGRLVEEVVGADVWRAIGPRIDAALAGDFVEYETELRYANGGARWIHATYTPHRDLNGNVHGVVTMVTDISERKRAEMNAALLADLSQAFARNPAVEEAVRNVAERLVERLGLSRCLLAEIDDDADIIRVFQQHSREPEPSQEGEYRVSEFLTDDERRQLAEGEPLVIKDVREGRSAAAVERFRALGIGSVVSAPYVVDGQRRFALAAEKREPYAWKADEVELLREIAARIYLQLDRARAEQTLRGSELRYRSLASVLTNVPCNVDPIGRIVEPQPAWERYTGQSFAESRDFGWFEAVHPDDREPARQAWIEALHARRPYEVRVRIWHAPTRQFRHIIARATPLLGNDGRIVEWVGACTDVHEATAQAHALLEADRRKDEFLATLAHELRNPLAPIRNSLHILKLTGKAEGALASVYQILDRQVRHVVRLVDDLMDVSRITRGRVELRRQATDVQAVVQSAIETSRPLIDESGHRLEVSMPVEPIRLEADPIRLAQAVTNLLNNSAKYTEPGGRIWVTAQREGRMAVISVRDDGRGIAPDMLPRVFDLFTQASPGHDYSRGGLGIGLTLVRSMVELHGGSVEARSEGLRRGSEFVLRIPLDAAEPGYPGIQAPASAEVASRRVLVVDDNRDAADSLGVLLTLLGLETRTAHDGTAALEAFDEFRPALVLLDLGMPRMNGYELAQRLRQHPHGRFATIVAITGWGHERDRLRSAESGIDHHLVKPVDVEELRQLLAKLAKTAALERRA